MQKILIITITIGALFLAEWIYRSYIRPIDPLQPEVLALAKHFNKNGLKVRPYAVRHALRHSSVLAVAAFEINDFPLAILVDLCPSEQKAEGHLLAITHSPNLMYPKRNNRIVMYLPMWGDDTKEMANKVINLFSSFNHDT